MKTLLRALLAALALVLLLVAAGGIWYLADREGMGAVLVQLFTPEYLVDTEAPVAPTFKGDSGPRIEVELEEIAADLTLPTDVQFAPGRSDLAIVLEKRGRAVWLDLATGERGVLLDTEVLSASEQGLLGLAFHPDFASNGKFYLNTVVDKDGSDTSRIAEWTVDDPSDLRNAKAQQARVMMDVHQPYPNHDAGQLAFGPDGFLYVGWGDGGLRGDPGKHGQNLGTLLGAMVRIDVNHPGENEPYSIPDDNPFLRKEGVLPEIWAYGLRNPWRYSFDRRGRMIVADVGQDLWEEVSIVAAGDNLGWPVREAFECFEDHSRCGEDGFVDPIHSYGREHGTSITGGYEYTGRALPALEGHYLFGDFTSGRIWALKLPDERRRVRPSEVASLGRWPLLISSFGRDHDGEIYVLGFARGALFKLTPAQDKPRNADSAAK